LRKILGRSPDRYDALALSVWEPLSLREQSGRSVSSTARSAPVAGLDPYAAQAKWRR
jgi:O-acetyl-ADP-ribose deacetylase (regulator of RNase III)